MFQINVDNPSETITNALKAIGTTKQTELASRLGLKDSTQLSRAKNAGELSSKLIDRFKTLQAELGDDAADLESSPLDDSSSQLDAAAGGTFSIELLQADESIQQRWKHSDEATVTEYYEAGMDGWPFPPITVFRDGDGKHWLADGFHRVEAAYTLELESIPADIRSGTRRDALLFAVGANATHGLPRTQADKRQAVQTMLDDPEWSQWSDREIARQCNVHHQLVGKQRALMESSKALDESSSQIADSSDDDIDEAPIEAAASKPPKVRKTKNGRTIDIANVSKSNKSRAKAPATPAKRAQEAIHRFGGACSDLREVEKHLTESEMFKIAERCRDQLIWAMRSLPSKDITAFVAKVNEAAKEVA